MDARNKSAHDGGSLLRRRDRRVRLVAARECLRDEIRRLRTTELAVIDDPTAKVVAMSRTGAAPPRSVSEKRGNREGPHKPDLDEMGPAVESRPYRAGPRSTTGRAGMRGGWRPRGR